ncbi:sulfotransferase family 2 domain-containing protein [Gymnodinialimonas ulvae]|uniref:sulfotransferase family 2 domain-containing protein n=1 Tax=Gymnodinialimonas ulvae TaxID=3126504 RepID=UPI003095D003
MARRLLGTRFEDKYSSRQLKAIARYHLGIAKHLFIHIPKNGGLTIRNSRAMRRRVVLADPYFHKSPAYTQALAEAMAAERMHHGNQHARLIDVRADVRARLQAVAIIRNPWSRTYSRFLFGGKAALKRGRRPDFSQQAFEAFLEQRHTYADKPFFWHRAVKGWYPQLDYVRDEQGRIAADILRLEHMDAEIARYFGVEGMRTANHSRQKAPHYTEVYTDRTRQIVADWYAADIETFGFDFVGGATRNCHYAEAQAPG